MSLDASSSALHLNLPPSSTSSVRPPTSITVHPSVIASILTQHTRRPENATPQSRVMGVLMGFRSESGLEVDVRTCFGVPHNENTERIELDMQFQHSMVGLLNRTGTKEVVVGWYATNPEMMNAYSAILQNHFSTETAPFPAVHLTVDTALTAEGKGLGVKGWVSTSLGLSPRPENCVFLPVPVSIKFADSERAAMDLLTSSNTTPTPSLPPLPNLSSSLADLSHLISQCLEYVSSVNSGKQAPDVEVGRYLLEGVGRWSNAGTEDDGGVREGVQDTLTVAYLSNLVRSQMELGGRLALLPQGQSQQQQQQGQGQEKIAQQA